jgi:hypothetical protein
LLVIMDQSAFDYEGLPGSGTYRQNLRYDANPDLAEETEGFDGVTLNPGDEQLGISGGSLGVEPIEHEGIFVGPSPRAWTAASGTSNNNGRRRERIYHLRRMLSVESSTHGLKRNEATIFPVTFRLLPGSVSGAQYGTIRDRVITTA